MVARKVIAICQSGGEFETDKDGFLSYKGGDAHAMEVDDDMEYKHFKEEVAEMFNYNVDTMCIKYFLPSNKKKLITISNDKDLKNMIKFHGDSDTAEVYVMTEEVVAPDVSNMPGSRSSRTTLSEAGIPVDAPPDVMDDADQPGLLLDANFDIVGDTHPLDADINLPAEMVTPLAVSNVFEERQIKAAHQWQNNITGVGQRFNSVHEFREALRKYAIGHQFAFRYKKNDSHRVTVKCKVEGCPWRIHASRLSTTQLICIKKMNPTHTCEGATASNGYQATRNWIASIIKEKLEVYPNYKPKDIVNDIKQEFGIHLNYFQAWRGKEIAKEQIQGSYKEAYSQLPIFCEKIMETNPGSHATFTTKEDSSFHRLFISFYASLYGFEHGCRPLLFLDSILLRSKYQGTLLAATAADGDDGVFPVAFAVVDAESDENWRWFLLQLKNALSTCCSMTSTVDGESTPKNSLERGITIIADREKGLRESIAEIFPNGEVYHAYCLRYLSEQLMRDLKGQFSHEVKRLLVEDLFSTAYAPKFDGFSRCIESIRNMSPEAYNWIVQSEPDHWANACLPIQASRYNHMTSNFGELFYSWVSDAHELPITQMVDAIRGKIMELINTRRNESNQWVTRLTPSMHEKLEQEGLKARPLQVLVSSGDKFDVHGDSIETVDVNRNDCSCKIWQLTGLPCCHAIAVFIWASRDPYDYCSRYFLADSYRLIYSESINPVPNIDRPWKKGVSGGAVVVTPPPTRRPPGRPSTKKTGSQESAKRQLQCSRCKATGHNKSTCKEFMLEN